MPGKTVQTQIRLPLDEQSDQGLHCLPFPLHRLDSLHYGRAIRVITIIFLGVRIFRRFTVKPVNFFIHPFCGVNQITDDLYTLRIPRKRIIKDFQD